MGSAKPVAAVVGSNSLLGRELRDVLARTPFQTRLIGADEIEAGTLTEERGEPLIITTLDEENLAAARVVFLAGSAESSGKAMEIISRLRPRPLVVDLTGALEERPTAHLRAPVVEPAGYKLPPESEQIVAHPAAILLALFLVRLGKTGTIRRGIAHIFEPASERGQRGLDELQKQTVNLFAFKPLPKAVFDAQVSFNMLPAWGADAPQSLADVELRIERHLASLLGPGSSVPMPSLHLVQAPVFHGYSFSLWVLFDAPAEPDRIAAELTSVNIDVRSGDQEPPTSAGIAGQSGIVVGSMMKDRNQPQACWFWMAADNLRMSADNCVEVIREVAG